MNYEIRKANPMDAEAIFSMICELAEYEKMTDDVIGTAEMLHDHLSKEQVSAFMLEADGKPVGFALYFYNYSTFKGRRGLYLEDLYIKPEHRKGGYGKKLIETLIATAKAEHCGRMEWSCLNWNEPSIAFYRHMGAKPMDEWTVWRLDESQF